MKALVLAWLLSILSSSAFAASDMMENFDPHSPFAPLILNYYDKYYEEVTGESAFPLGKPDLWIWRIGGCYQMSCAAFIHVNRATQTLTVFENGKELELPDYRTSTGLADSTPPMDYPPNGRIYTKYSSSKHRGGDYNGLGNMPYAIFIVDGFAIHGTPRSNWSRLSRQASHGCIRVHPDTMIIIHRLVRKYGIRKSWITVE